MSSSARSSKRRPARALGRFVAALAAAGVSTCSRAGAAIPIPVPDAIVVVTTKSGNVTQDAPRADRRRADPDRRRRADAARRARARHRRVGRPRRDRRAAGQADRRPNIVVTRNAARGHARTARRRRWTSTRSVILRDAADALRPFVDGPLRLRDAGRRAHAARSSARSSSARSRAASSTRCRRRSTRPGYSGPLKLKIRALTHDLDAKFALDFDALPEAIFISEDPREDGLDVLYEHTRARRRRAPRRDRDAAQPHERTSCSTSARRSSACRSASRCRTRTRRRRPTSATTRRSTLSNPDLQRDATATSTATAASSPTRSSTSPGCRRRWPARSRPSPTTRAARTSTPSTSTSSRASRSTRSTSRCATSTGRRRCPAPFLNPEQHIAFASRFVGGATRFRAAGRLLRRSARRSSSARAPKNDIVDATTDLGDGVRPLRALSTSTTATTRGRRRGRPAHAIDTTLAPLPSRSTRSTSRRRGRRSAAARSSRPRASMDVDATRVIADGPGRRLRPGRGDVRERAHRRRPDAARGAPAGRGRERLRHPPQRRRRAAPGRQRATIDVTNAEARAHVRRRRASTRVPPRSTAAWTRATRCCARRSSTAATGLHADRQRLRRRHRRRRSAACASPSATSPERGTLPPRAGHRQAVRLAASSATSASRSTGRVDEVRNVAFRQRDDDNDGEADGTLGALVDAGSGGRSTRSDRPRSTAPRSTQAWTSASTRCRRFSACVRQNDDAAPPTDELPPTRCWRRATAPTCSAARPARWGDAAVGLYNASDADEGHRPESRRRQPDADDGGRAATRSRSTRSIDKVPGELRADVIPPLTPTTAKPPAASSSWSTTPTRRSRRSTSGCRAAARARSARTRGPTARRVPGGDAARPARARSTATSTPTTAEGDIVFVIDAAGDRPAAAVDRPAAPVKVSPIPTAAGAAARRSVLDITRSQGSRTSLQAQAADRPTDGDGEKELGRLAFNACPDPGACDGIGEIAFNATNALVGDPLPAASDARDPADGVTQDFSFIQRGDDFRAAGQDRRSSRRSGCPSSRPAQRRRRRRRRSRAAFGNGTPTEKCAPTSTRNVRAPSTLASPTPSSREAPTAINLCLRDELDAAGPRAEPRRSRQLLRHGAGRQARRCRRA